MKTILPGNLSPSLLISLTVDCGDNYGKRSLIALVLVFGFLLGGCSGKIIPAYEGEQLPKEHTAIIAGYNGSGFCPGGSYLTDIWSVNSYPIREPGSFLVRYAQVKPGKYGALVFIRGGSEAWGYGSFTSWAEAGHFYSVCAPRSGGLVVFDTNSGTQVPIE